MFSKATTNDDRSVILEQVITVIKGSGMVEDGLDCTEATNLATDLGMDGFDMLELAIEVEDHLEIGEISDEVLESVTTVGSFTDIVMKMRAGETVGVAPKPGVVIDLDDPDYTVTARQPNDVEFYGEYGHRMARIRRVYHTWGGLRLTDGWQGETRVSRVLSPEEPEHPEQLYQMEQFCEDGRWRIISGRPDLEFVKSVAQRWVEHGGEITEFFADQTHH